ncbi:helix-turn-helix domain-containing protein [Paucilactobacillus kaifaensis]|uniref:helix-turn-helix domain-containing protein n=1 Tax=Paucilactobacillus kaifaensis TaxID=2559921 RepID=UPI0010F88065|nr:helix-turn-helix transcriptional regulator [Paucilactobacillus kaifaensis]
MWNKVIQILKEKDMSIYKLARLTGIQKNTLYSYTAGAEPSFKNACKIADALNISLDKLREADK